MYCNNSDDIDGYYISITDNDGENRARELRRLHDMECSHFGYMTSHDGSYTGELGVDYHVFSSLQKAKGQGCVTKVGTVNGRLPAGQGQMTEKHIIDAMKKDEKGLHISNRSRGDMWIRLSLLAYPHTPGNTVSNEEDICYPFSLDDLVYDEDTLKYKLRNARNMEVVDEEDLLL
jgi:hypothetical protein